MGSKGIKAIVFDDTDVSPAEFHDRKALNAAGKKLVQLLMEDPGTEGIIMIGEIGGSMEADAAYWIKEHGTKPVVGFIAGKTAPKGRKMGHAGAIVEGASGTAEAKVNALREAGVAVAEHPEQVVDLLP